MQSEQSAQYGSHEKCESEAAGEMIDNLTLVFNKARRQAGITQEISEISAGMASVS
jgi:F0F1-type ATP synthase gamma subunit